MNIRKSENGNLTEVSIGGVTLWFSYETCVAFAVPGVGTRVCENVWSNTTSRHLNSIDGGRESARLAREVFLAELSAVEGFLATRTELATW